MLNKFLLLLISLNLYKASLAVQDVVIGETPSVFSIEGRVYPPLGLSSTQKNWQVLTSVMLNGGKHLGFLNEEGEFVITGVPSGSYVLEVTNPDYRYDPVRVEINSKGKIRARTVNYVQSNKVFHVSYPLILKSLGPYKYFQTREEWKILDVLLNPMILMMGGPLLIMVVLPKLIRDPETKKEIENIQLPKMTEDLPEISEMITSLFNSKEPKQDKKLESNKKAERDHKGGSSRHVKKRN